MVVPEARRKNTNTGQCHKYKRVRVVAQQDQRTRTQEAVGAETASALTGDDDGSRCKGWPKCNETREGSVNGEHQPAGEHCRNTGPAQENTEPAPGLQVRNRQGKEGSQGEFPQAGTGVKVGICLVGGGLLDGEHERCHEDHTEGDEQQLAVTQGFSLRKQPGQQRLQQGDSSKDQWPQNEHLALDGQRPKVLEGAGVHVLLGVVVHREGGKLPVLPVHQGCPRLGEDVRPPALRDKCPGTGEDCQQDDHDGGQQSLENVEPVPHKLQWRAAFELAGEGQRQQESRDQQEDVHSAGDLAEPDMVSRNHEHSQGTQALDFRAETGFGLLPGGGRLLRRRSRFWHHRCHPVAANHLSSSMPAMLWT